jgi:hypothetical protein
LSPNTTIIISRESGNWSTPSSRALGERSEFNRNQGLGEDQDSVCRRLAIDYYPQRRKLESALHPAIAIPYIPICQGLSRDKPVTGGRNSMDLDANLRRYLEGHKPNERYASFDYCFNYFQSFRESGDASALASPTNVQLSCLQLGFYLASWGMLRGSAELLQKSARNLIPIIEVVAHTEASLWELDAHCYTESNIQRLLQLANTIRRAQPSMSDTLVTKIILGVFGGCRVSTFGPKALRKIGRFFQEYADVINAHRVPTLDFISGDHTQRAYTRAKVIDMVFFIEGQA